MNNVEYRSSGQGLMPIDIKHQAEAFVKKMPEAMQNSLHTVDYASFTAITGLFFEFSPEKMKENNISEEQIKTFITEHSSEFPKKLQIDCNFEEESDGLSINEEMRLRREAIDAEEW